MHAGNRQSHSFLRAKLHVRVVFCLRLFIECDQSASACNWTHARIIHCAWSSALGLHRASGNMSTAEAAPGTYVVSHMLQVYCNARNCYAPKLAQRWYSFQSSWSALLGPRVDVPHANLPRSDTACLRIHLSATYALTRVGCRCGSLLLYTFLVDSLTNSQALHLGTQTAELSIDEASNTFHQSRSFPSWHVAERRTRASQIAGSRFREQPLHCHNRAQPTAAPRSQQRPVLLLA